MTGSAPVHRPNALVRLVLVVGIMTSLLIRWPVSDLTCLVRVLRAVLTFSSSRRDLALTAGLTLLSSRVENGLAVSGTIRLTAPAMLSCSVSVVQPMEQLSRPVVLCMWWVTLLLPLCPLDSMCEMAVTDMLVAVVMPATESLSLASFVTCRFPCCARSVPVGLSSAP